MSVLFQWVLEVVLVLLLMTAAATVIVYDVVPLWLVGPVMAVAILGALCAVDTVLTDAATADEEVDR